MNTCWFNESCLNMMFRLVTRRPNKGCQRTALTCRVCLRCRLMRCSMPQAMSQLTELCNAQHCTFIAHGNCALIHTAPENCTFYCTCVCTLYRTWPPRLCPILHFYREFYCTYFFTFCCTWPQLRLIMRSFIARLSKRAISAAVWEARCKITPSEMRNIVHSLGGRCDTMRKQACNKMRGLQVQFGPVC